MIISKFCASRNLDQPEESSPNKQKDAIIKMPDKQGRLISNEIRNANFLLIIF